MRQSSRLSGLGLESSSTPILAREPPARQKSSQEIVIRLLDKIVMAGGPADRGRAGNRRAVGIAARHDRGTAGRTLGSGALATAEPAGTAN